MKRVGIIVAGSAYPMDGFKSGLQDLGWIEGEHVNLTFAQPKGNCICCLNSPPKWSAPVSTSSPSSEL